MATKSVLQPVFKVTQKRYMIPNFTPILPRGKIIKCNPEMLSDIAKIAQDIKESFQHASTEDIKIIEGGQLMIFKVKSITLEKKVEMPLAQKKEMKFKEVKFRQIHKVGDYEVFLTLEDEGIFTVEVPKLPGCITFGSTIEEALKNAREAIDCHLEAISKHQK